MESRGIFPIFQRSCLDYGIHAEQVSRRQHDTDKITTYDIVIGLDASQVSMRVAEVMEHSAHATTAQVIMHSKDASFLLMPRITSRLSSELRTLGINHGDVYGRLSLRSTGLLIEVDGRSPLKRSTDAELSEWINEPKRPSAIDLLSPKSAQIVFCLLTWPRLLMVPSRKIAETAGASLGLVSRTINHLTDLGHIDEGKGWTRSGRIQMAQAWLATYPSKLGPALNLGLLEGPSPSGIEVQDGVLSAGSAIPWLIRPAITTVYVADTSAAFLRANRLRKGERPNVFLRRQFWRTPAEEISGSTIGELPTAPPLLVYADLLSSDDPREQEMARVFLREEPRLNWLREIGA